MPTNEYKITRLENRRMTLDVGGNLTDNVVTSVVAAMTATCPEDGYSDFIDAEIKLTVDPENFIQFKDLTPEWPMAIAERYAEENNWKEQLDKRIEAKRIRPMSGPWPWEEAQEKPAE